MARARQRTLGAWLATIAGAAAIAATNACAPASFDGLVGGTKPEAEDPSLAAPQPISPLSVTTVATSRPKLGWSLADGATGAVVEMSRTRAFDPAATRTFEAKGRELVVPEDLEPGIWFWRLRSKGEGTVGTASSATWELLVRGPAANGSSDAPTGSVVDWDGDGIADLVTVGDDDYGPMLLIFRGQPDGISQDPYILDFLGVGRQSDRMRATATSGLTHRVSPGSLAAGAELEPVGDAAVTGGLDVDGDGLGDVWHIGLDRAPGDPYDHVIIEYGTTDLQGGPREDGFQLAVAAEALPTLTVAGDVNGDGHADLLYADDVGGTIAMGGGAYGLGALVPMVMGMKPGDRHPLLGGFDANSDGVSDVAIALAPPNAPMAAIAGGRATMFQPKSFDAPEPARQSAASALATGDFDGDGVADVAGTIRGSGGASVCFWRGDATKFLAPAPCAAAIAGDADFGASLTAADLDGDGKDELVASAKVGGARVVRAVRFDGSSATVSPLAAGVGAHLTTIWPGRPGKARWAASDDAGTKVVVFDGDAPVTTLQPPPDALVRGLGRALR